MRIKEFIKDIRSPKETLTANLISGPEIFEQLNMEQIFQKDSSFSD